MTIKIAGEPPHFSQNRVSRVSLPPQLYNFARNVIFFPLWKKACATETADDGFFSQISQSCGKETECKKGPKILIFSVALTLLIFNVKLNS